MSDTLPSKGYEGSPEVTEAEPVPVVPHSGLLPVEQGGERPVEVFDKTPLGAADEQALLEVPSNVPANVEQPMARRATPAEEPLTGKRSRRWRLPLAVIATAGLGVGGAFALGRGNAEEPKNVPAATASGPTPPPAVVPSSPETTLSPEVAEPKLDAVLMTATTGEGLLGQFKSNFNCMVGNGPIAQREKCFDYIIGGERGALTSRIRGRMDSATSYYATNPDENLNLEMSLVDSKFEPNGRKAILIAKIAGANGSSTMRYTFVPSPVEIVTGQVDNSKTTAWILYEESTVKPGEVAFK